MQNPEQIKELLGTGLSNEVVASAVGCEPSYITQLMADETFSAAVVSKRMIALTANTSRDRSIDSIEDTLIDKLQQLLADNLIYKPVDILRAFALVNAAKRRGVNAQSSLVVNNTVVNLVIPQRVVQQFTKNAQGEIVEVAGQTLVTMPAHQLLKNLANRGDGKVYEQVSRFLPTTIDGSCSSDGPETPIKSRLDNFGGNYSNHG